MREVAAELERPVLLFSGGKDSIVLLRLAEKAFRPARFPFPLMHVDTGHNFPEVIEFRDRRVAELGERLIVASRAGLDRRRAAWSRRPARARRATACRRPRCSTRSPSTASTPPSAARAATRSGRARRSASSPSATTSASGTPRPSAPSCGTSTTGASARASTCACSRCPTGPSSTCGSTSSAEDLEVPSIYFAHEREVFRRDGMLYAVSPHVQLIDGEEPFTESVRYRTVGDMTCTGAVASTARALEDVVAEIAATHDHRARRDARRRQRLRGRDGGPQGGRLLLGAPDGSLRRPAAPRHGRLGRRRQVDAHRAPAARRQGDPRRPARRPARRATASSTSRALTDGLRAEREQGITIDVAYRYFATAAAHVHPRRHARPRAVHAQHGHRRLDRRPGHRARRRAQRRGRADAPPRVHRLAAAASRTSSWRSTRWTSSTTPRRPSTRSCATSAPSARSSRSRDTAFVPISALHGDNVVERSEAMPWYGGLAAARAPRDRRDRRPTATSTSCASPCSACIRDGDRATTAATRGRWPAACCAPATRSLVLPSGASPPSPSIDTLDGPLDEAFPPMSVTVRLADDLDVSRGDLSAAPPTARPLARDLRPTSAGWPTRRCAPAGATRSSTRRTRRAAIVEVARRPRRRRHACSREPATAELGAQRHRPRAPAHLQAAGVRPLRAQPRRPARSSSSTRRRTTRSARA